MKAKKKYMRMIYAILTLALLVCVLSVFAACEQNNAPTKLYTVTFVYNDDVTANVSNRVSEGGKVTEPTTPVRDGFSFVGWYDNAGLTSKYNFDSLVTKNIMLYAKWTSQYTVTFVYNDDITSDTTVFVNDGDKVGRPTDPSREEYTFDGWYSDASFTTAYDFAADVTAVLTLYAKWTPLVSTITYVYNDEVTSNKIEKIDTGNTLAKPSDPTRANYIFDGWFTDEDLTLPYDFTVSVSGNLTLYASWLEEGETYYNVTLHYNDNVTPDKIIRVKDNGRAQQPSTPSKTGHEFIGWYTDESYTSKFVFSTRITADTDLYVKWGEIFLFEAENTDISGIIGQGYSGPATGSDIIGRGAGSSNGYYLTYLYNTGIEIVFGITSDEAVSDAKLALSLSAEYSNFTIDGETYQIIVNDVALSYSVSFTDVPADQGADKKPFEYYEISSSVSLKKGINTIKLVTNNSDPLMGTMRSTAPMVDCLKLVSASKLEWNEAAGYPFDNTSTLT